MCPLCNIYSYAQKTVYASDHEDEVAKLRKQLEEAENEEIEISNILSRSTEKELAFANDALDMRSPGKGSDPNAMIYDLSSNQLDHSVDKINMVIDILKNLKSKYIISKLSNEPSSFVSKTLSKCLS